ncbi:MAG: hypothetical protein AB9861_10365 [Methanosarcina sp.]
MKPEEKSDFEAEVETEALCTLRIGIRGAKQNYATLLLRYFEN